MSQSVRSQGFTFVELVLIVVISGILFTGGIAGYNNFNRKRTVREAALNLLNNLRFVQNKALTGEKPSFSFACPVLKGWKLEFNQDNYNYKIQAVCDVGGQDVEAGEVKNYSLPAGLLFAAQTRSFLFKVLAQGVDFTDNGEVIISGLGWTYKIKVTRSGEISDEGFQ